MSMLLSFNYLIKSNILCPFLALGKVTFFVQFTLGSQREKFWLCFGR